MSIKYIKCAKCGINIPFKGGRHKYCDVCKIQVDKEKAKLRDWKRTVKRRAAEAEKRLCKCPECGVEFSRLSQGSNKKYCGSSYCEYKRTLNNSYKSNRKILDAKKSEKNALLRKYYEHHGVGKSFDGYSGDKFVKVGRNIAYSQEYVEYCLSICGYELLDKYSNTTDKLLMKCPNGHKVKISFGKFLHSNQRCSTCKALSGITTSSYGEVLISGWLEELGLDFIYRDKFVLSKYKLELDFYIPSKKIAIEVCGLYWHSELGGGLKRNYHRTKYDKCCELGVRLITIFYDELINYKEVVKSRICNSLNMCQEKVYARKTECCILDKSEAKSFLNKYHLQGYSNCSFAVGLIYQSKLVGVMTWGSLSRAHTKVDRLPTMELKRFAFLPNISVVGGSSKMFKFSKDVINTDFPSVEFLKSFCDMRYANPFKTVYDILGFDLYDETKYTPHYLTDHYSKRLRNQGLAKSAKDRLSGSTEWNIRRNQGYDRIWDCGHRSYIYKL